jgi:hypothetical protein
MGRLAMSEKFFVVGLCPVIFTLAFPVGFVPGLLRICSFGFCRQEEQDCMPQNNALRRNVGIADASGLSAGQKVWKVYQKI